MQESTGLEQSGSVLGALRFASGVAFIVGASQVGHLLVGTDADSPGAALFIRAFGARDALLGLGVLRAARTPQVRRQWFMACGLADAFDAAATLAAYRRLPPRRRAFTFVVSAVPALLNLASARQAS